MSPPTPSPISITPLTEADFAIVAHLGESIWRTHYATMISMAQIDYMLAGRFAPDNLRRYLDATDRWLDLLCSDGTPVGYCSYALTPSPEEIKLEQIYLLAEHRGRGLGAALLAHVETRARGLGAARLALQVNKGNHGSITFYRHAGFSVREAACFDIGNGFVMDDYVMEKDL
jgi:diamine N-acetyltransferase